MRWLNSPGRSFSFLTIPTFLTRIATRVVEIEEGQARNYFGDYEYYLWKKAQEFESIKETSEELEAAAQATSSGPTRAMVAAGAAKRTRRRAARFDQNSGTIGKASVSSGS